MKIELDTLPEDMSPKRAEKQFGYTSGFADAVQSMMKRAKGRWGWCTARVTVTIGGRSAVDYLGQCSYESEQDFVSNSGYFMDMVNNCLASIENG